MNQTRAELDSKLTQLQERAKDMTPRRYVQRHMPSYALDRAIGAVLTMAGTMMAWRMYRRSSRRARIRQALVSYGCW
jgi:uncharacterized membrane protein YccC